MALDAMEMKLRPPEIVLKPYPPKLITLASGEKMVVREAKREEVGALLGTVYPLIGVPTDFYDIVAVRMYSEILGWYRHRVANEFVLVGAIDGVAARSPIAVVAAVGDGMRGTVGIAAKVFAAVARAGVNVESIAQGSSECNISFAVDEKDRVAAVRALHEAVAP